MMDEDDYEDDPLDALSADEVRAIASLKRLAKKWPRTLRLASMDGELVVIHADDDRFFSDDPLERAEAVLEGIHGIPNTGGGW